MTWTLQQSLNSANHDAGLLRKYRGACIFLSCDYQSDVCADHERSGDNDLCLKIHNEKLEQAKDGQYWHTSKLTRYEASNGRPSCKAPKWMDLTTNVGLPLLSLLANVTKSQVVVQTETSKHCRVQPHDLDSSTIAEFSKPRRWTVEKV